MCGGGGGGDVLFNDALNTFYLRLYGVGHTVKDHSDSERRVRNIIGQPSQKCLIIVSLVPSHCCIFLSAKINGVIQK